jgi:hypothetical protein
MACSQVQHPDVSRSFVMAPVQLVFAAPWQSLAGQEKESAGQHFRANRNHLLTVGALEPLSVRNFHD